MTVISLFWYGSAHWQVTPSLSLISFTNSHVLYFFISFIFSLFLHSNAANILMFLILIPWYLFSVHILFRLNSDLTAKYNDETDYLEILTNGNWQPGLYVGAKYYKIFEAGSILRWSLSLDNDKNGLLDNGVLNYNTAGMNIQLRGGTWYSYGKLHIKSNSFYSANGYKKLRMIISGNSETGTFTVTLLSSIDGNSILKTNNISITNMSSLTYELDISELGNTPFYIMLSVQMPNCGPRQEGGGGSRTMACTVSSIGFVK